MHDPLAELHAHLAASISPALYWQIAHDHGFKLPKRDFHEFINYITLSEKNKKTMKEYFDDIYHPLLDKLSSGTFALETAVYHTMSGAYRANNITLIELRNNPMKHNNNAELDLDHIIMAMLRGMERALLEYEDLSAGLIFCLDRQFSYEQNKIIIEKAIKYKRRGVVGIDVANYDNGTFHFEAYGDLFALATKEGLGITIHSGETNDTNDMWDALRFANPQRIGHGIKAAYDKALMQELVRRNVVLEVCPLSNIVTKAVADEDELRFILKTFKEHKVRFCINTDWPELIEGAHLTEQRLFVKEKGILSEEDLAACNTIAFESSFIPGKGLTTYL